MGKPDNAAKMGRAISFCRLTFVFALERKLWSGGVAFSETAF